MAESNLGHSQVRDCRALTSFGLAMTSAMAMAGRFGVPEEWKLYVGTRRGVLWVLAASKDKRVISSIKLDSPIVGTPVAANGVLYIATMKKLYAVRKSTE